MHSRNPYQYGLEVTATYGVDRDQWELRWEPGSDGQTTQRVVRAAIAADPQLASHASAIAGDASWMISAATVTTTRWWPP
ncbi:hypothetical protein [Frankia sp. CiP3]|uniref:hypothetical protein n=1 Tax=Frankia sp. CiP3 TaxID=2880971 RepID=UPI001EF40A0C|nr:hypothetical protein [Frankia sp. CiP3]